MKMDDDWELPQFGEERPTEYYNYRCKQCKYEEGVPDFVVDEFAMGEDLPPGELPEVVCPECGNEMRFTGETYTEEN